MKLAINLLAILVAGPLILYWQYFAVQSDFTKLEQKQIAAFERVPVPVTLAAPKPVEKPVIIEHKPLGLQIVRTTKPLHYTDKDLFCMAKNIYHEAAREPDLGKYAVAQITLNRKHNPRYPKNICAVILEPYQFSWANNHKIRWTQPHGPAWEQAKKIAEDVIIRGYRVQGLEHGMYYHADYVNPKWRDNTAKIAQVGRHIFYSRAL